MLKIISGANSCKEPICIKIMEIQNWLIFYNYLLRSYSRYIWQER